MGRVQAQDYNTKENKFLTLLYGPAVSVTHIVHQKAVEYAF